MFIPRKKTRSLTLSIIYKIFVVWFSKILPQKKLMKIFLYVEWMSRRLAQNLSYLIYPDISHPGRQFSIKRIKKITNNSIYSIMDLGCGYGHYSNEVAKNAKKVIGIDYDAMVINNAKKKYTKDNLSFICDDVWNYLNSNNETFDILILAHILEHLDNPEIFLKKVHNFFEYVYIEVPDFDESLNNQLRIDIETAYIYNDEDHVNEFNRDELQELIQICNYKIIDVEYKFGVQSIWVQRNYSGLKT